MDTSVSKSALTELKVPILAKKELAGWPPTKDGETGRPKQSMPIFYLPLANALTMRFQRDCYLAAYSNPEKPFRLNQEAIT